MSHRKNAVLRGHKFETIRSLSVHRIFDYFWELIEECSITTSKTQRRFDITTYRALIGVVNK